MARWKYVVAPPAGAAHPILSRLMESRQEHQSNFGQCQLSPALSWTPNYPRAAPRAADICFRRASAAHLYSNSSTWILKIIINEQGGIRCSTGLCFKQALRRCWRCPPQMLVAIVSAIWKGEGDQSNVEQDTIRGEIRLLWSTTNELKGKEDQGLWDRTQSIKQLNMFLLCQRTEHKDLLPRQNVCKNMAWIRFWIINAFEEKKVLNFKLKYIATIDRLIDNYLIKVFVN